MVTKSQILTNLAKRGKLNALDYPIEISTSDATYTDGVSLYIGQFKENTFDDIYPLIMHEYYHCRLKHFTRVEQAKNPLMQYLHNIAMDIEINEYLVMQGITSKYFLDNGQFKKSNSLNIEIPANLHTFEEILQYIMAKLPEQKRQALSGLTRQDFANIGADLMGAPGEVNPNGLDRPIDLSEDQPKSEWNVDDVEIIQTAPEDFQIEDKQGGASLIEISDSLSRWGIEREVKMTQEHTGTYSLSWSRILRKFAGKLKGRILARTYQRPRRSGDFGRTVLPAFRNMEGTVANLDIYIDISGSMSNRSIKKFIETQRTLRQMSTETRISYFLFNEGLFPIKYHDLPDAKLGGGTSYQKVLDSVAQRKNPTILFTDMEADEGDLTRLQDYQDQLLVLTLNPEYKERKDLPYVIYVKDQM